jgi:hypothetical protein
VNPAGPFDPGRKTVGLERGGPGKHQLSMRKQDLIDALREHG